MAKRFLRTRWFLTATAGILWALPVLAQPMDKFPAFAQPMGMDGGIAATVPEHIMGPIFAGRMLHAWLGLAAAVVIFFMTLGMMRGGRLAQPIFLIGLGVLADALFGVLLPPLEHAKWMWLGSILQSGAIVVGILWIGYIFGVFQRRSPSIASK